MGIDVASLREEYGADERGIIRGPGRLEGEPLWVAYFDARQEEGDDASGDPGVCLEFTLNDDERAAFPSLAGETTVVLSYAREDGFVVGYLGSEWNAE